MIKENKMLKSIAIAAAALTLATGAQAQSRHGNHGAQVATGVAVGFIAGMLVDRAMQPPAPVYVQPVPVYAPSRDPRDCIQAIAGYDRHGNPMYGVFCR